MRVASKKRRLSWVGGALCVVALGTAGTVALGDAGGGQVNPAIVDGTQHYPELQIVPAQTLAQFPVLAKAPDSQESQQLPVISQAVEALGKLPGGLAGAGANPSLARAYYRDDQSAGYLVPGNSGIMCNVQLYEGKPVGAGCGSASDWLAKGTVSTLVVPGGYAISGLLPPGTSTVSITVAGKTSALKENGDGGFDVVESAAPSRVSYTLPSGKEVVDMTELPPAPSEH